MNRIAQYDELEQKNQIIKHIFEPQPALKKSAPISITPLF